MTLEGKNTTKQEFLTRKHKSHHHVIKSIYVDVDVGASYEETKNTTKT